jgi:hypothetical protein
MSRIDRAVILWLAVFGVVAVAFVASSLGGEQYQPTLLRQPLFGAGWVPPEPAAPPAARAEAAPDGDQLRRIEEKLDRLLRLLEGLAGEEPGGPKAERPVADGKADLFSAAVNTCVTCHSDRTSKKGDEFVLLRHGPKTADGQETVAIRDDLGRADLRRIVKKIEAGDMPKSKKLTPEERDAILTEFRERLKRAGD